MKLLSLKEARHAFLSVGNEQPSLKQELVAVLTLASFFIAIGAAAGVIMFLMIIFV